jgi:hypothetical protein
MTTRVLAVPAVLALAVGLTVTVAPTAMADAFCGNSSRGAAVYAGNAGTSCQFAMNTAEAYHLYGNGSEPFDVYSPVTGQTYTMTCTSAGSVCQGGNGALVYLE